MKSKQMFLGHQVLQEFYETPYFNKRRCTIGSWVIFGAPAELGI
jgi:glutathionylspermidine synthase